MSRIQDATLQKKHIGKLLKTRVKNKDWKNIYPINNHDFDYKEYVLNNYNPFKLGITNTPDMDGLINSTIKTGSYVNKMLQDPMPDMSTKSGRSDVNTSSKPVRLYMTKIKDKYSEMPLPYPSFKKDYPEKLYPTKGEASSSYFVNVGSCKSKIDNKKQCISSGFKWVNNSLGSLDKNIKKFFSTTKNRTNKETQPKKNPQGICYRPKFIYVDNTAKGSLGLKGLAPSTNYDIMSITPDKLLPILGGYSTGGGGLIPCGKESYVNHVHALKKDNKNNTIIVYIVCFISTIVFFIIIFKNLYK